MRQVLLLPAAFLVPDLAQAAPLSDSAAVAMARPLETIVAHDIAPARLSALLKPVEAFYGFWINASPSLLSQALAPTFVDHTLPPGRPQGPAGPAQASRAFLAAVPDLELVVVQRLVVGDRVVSHLRFTGRFTGTLMGRRGTGQKIDFIATDIVRVRGDRITDNWHIEDNLAFLQQVGAVQPRQE